MSQDLDAILNGWEYQPETVQARLVRAEDGRQVIHLRVDLGVLQLETAGRPDGTCPEGYTSYASFLKNRIQQIVNSGEAYTLSEIDCREVDREFMQFYHRRVCWLALGEFRKAVADADHTLGLMDLVRDHAPTEEYRLAHEQYRAFVLFHRTQAEVASAVEQNDPELAIDIIQEGIRKIQQFYAQYDLGAATEEDGMIEHLHKMERTLRTVHGIDSTLQEQLAQAIASENYEAAARLRDALNARTRRTHRRSGA